MNFKVYVEHGQVSVLTKDSRGINITARPFCQTRPIYFVERIKPINHIAIALNTVYYGTLDKFTIYAHRGPGLYEPIYNKLITVPSPAIPPIERIKRHNVFDKYGIVVDFEELAFLISYMHVHRAILD